MPYPALVRDPLERLGLQDLLQEGGPDRHRSASQFERKDIEQAITAVVRRELERWQLPFAASSRPIPEQRWRLISGLQKSIRYGLVEHAADLAGRAVQIKPDHLWRRLAIIAVEDVGIANLFAVAVAMTAMANKSWRLQLGERKLATWLAALMASGPKDRIACELLTLVDFDRAIAAKANDWTTLSDQVLAQFAMDQTLSKADRVLALWLLAGTQRYPSQILPRCIHRSEPGLLDLMRAQPLPLVLTYCLGPLTRHSDGLFIPFLLIDEMLRESAVCEEHQHPLPPTIQLQGVTSAAYDMHTREGLTALRRFRHECEPLRRLVASIGASSPERLVGHAIFQAEGGVLDRRLLYAGSETVYNEANLIELGYFGLPHELHEEFLCLI